MSADTITIRIKRRSPKVEPAEVKPKSPTGWGTIKVWFSKDGETAEPIYLSEHKPERINQIKSILRAKPYQVLTFNRAVGLNGHHYQIWGNEGHWIVIDCGAEREEMYQNCYDVKHSFESIVDGTTEYEKLMRDFWASV